MGMFDKDKEIGLLLTSTFNQGEQFVLWDAKVDREDFPTRLGPTPRAMLTCSQIVNGRPGQRMEVSTVAGAIVAKVREAEQDDFPAVVFWRKAPSTRSATGEATVLQFVSAWGNAPVENRPAEVIPDSEFTAALPPLPDGPAGEPSDDDIPF